MYSNCLYNAPSYKYRVRRTRTGVAAYVTDDAYILNDKNIKYICVHGSITPIALKIYHVNEGTLLTLRILIKFSTRSPALENIFVD